LKRVVVAYQNRVVMEETLDQGLVRLFGEGAGTSRRPELAAADTVQTPVRAVADAAAALPADMRSVLQRARDHYDRAIAAQRSGDWATYGAELRRLGELLREEDAAPERPQ
jgi:uncharacterized membrane protein (UPF0182 family)